MMQPDREQADRTAALAIYLMASNLVAARIASGSISGHEDTHLVAALVREQARALTSGTMLGTLGSYFDPENYENLSAKPEATPDMANETSIDAAPEQEIYRSPNGDRWSIVTASKTASKMVRHRANLSSGGRITDVDVDTFLSVSGGSPEAQQLRRLLNMAPG